MYDLEGSELYSLKWYKNGKEFFRVMPSMSEHTKMFPVTGVSVSTWDTCHPTCDLTRLTILNVTQDTSGVFRCEVSTEAPHFFTTVDSVRVEVAGEEYFNEINVSTKVSI